MSCADPEKDDKDLERDFFRRLIDSGPGIQFPRLARIQKMKF